MSYFASNVATNSKLYIHVHININMFSRKSLSNPQNKRQQIKLKVQTAVIHVVACVHAKMTKTDTFLNLCVLIIGIMCDLQQCKRYMFACHLHVRPRFFLFVGLHFTSKCGNQEKN